MNWRLGENVIGKWLRRQIVQCEAMSTIPGSLMDIILSYLDDSALFWVKNYSPATATSTLLRCSTYGLHESYVVQSHSVVANRFERTIAYVNYGHSAISDFTKNSNNPQYIGPVDKWIRSIHAVNDAPHLLVIQQVAHRSFEIALLNTNTWISACCLNLGHVGVQAETTLLDVAARLDIKTGTILIAAHIYPLFVRFYLHNGSRFTLSETIDMGQIMALTHPVGPVGTINRLFMGHNTFVIYTNIGLYSFNTRRQLLHKYPFDPYRLPHKILNRVDGDDHKIYILSWDNRYKTPMQLTWNEWDPSTNQLRAGVQRIIDRYHVEYPCVEITDLFLIEYYPNLHRIDLTNILSLSFSHSLTLPH
jgi:hypothetical protein